MEKFVYNHDYHQALTYKIFNAAKTGKGDIITFEESLDIIKRIYNLTRGIKQIVYLIGWQYEGHDSKYPAWFEVNRKLKRECDQDARDSLLWLMEEGKKYNAVVSLHTNMCDAYENSPLWDEYKQKDLLIKDKNGKIKKGSIWDGEQSYWVSKTAEWRAGYAQKRIDEFLKFLPIADAGTIHIDVFQPNASEYHGITRDDEVDTMIQILKYWKERGVDVTKEWFHHEFVGMVPMVYHFNLSEESRLKYPPSLICGGGSEWNARNARDYTAVPWAGYFTAPEAGCAYEEAWGKTIDCDLKMDLSGFTEKFFLNTLPWYFLNGHKILSHANTSELYEVHFLQGVVASVRKSDRYFTIRQRRRLMLDDTDVFMPALWNEKEIMAYSKYGCDKEWEMPDSWYGIEKVNIKVLSFDEHGEYEQKPISNNKLRLVLKPNEAVVIYP